MIGGFQPLAFQTNFQQEAEVIVARRPRTHPKLRRIVDVNVRIAPIRVTTRLAQVVVSATVVASKYEVDNFAIKPSYFPVSPKPPVVQGVTVRAANVRINTKVTLVTVSIPTRAVAPAFVVIPATASVRRGFKVWASLEGTPEIRAGSFSTQFARIPPLVGSVATVKPRVVINPTDEELSAMIRALHIARKKGLTTRRLPFRV